MPNPVPQNDTTRLIVYAVMFLSVLGGTLTLVALGKMDAASGLQWIISGAGLIGSGMPGLKLAQDMRASNTGSSDDSDVAAQ
ncbi:Uncharacterised protein [Mycobacteroides abscessus subsp. abscessus]|uniref:hypothetical protein n=1 Tax=Mycobacteroides TaxID=670516 RepID=UPI00092B8950|nr:MULTISPECIES: hypothetical protein [Mycobacteroides]SHU95004.1 Uncharacterised protein [Mycobacteroides abscessus subsp. abscessus]SHX74529.1 Uncharacterised protein [Mycobacteroides abscessus subsp. abscessus]SIG85496.1 Uncharacterised protein [Mycobacteroides abscessus subsp. abscessus]SKD18774.1 Uncharacterised protein [Mycobacteroides abscessus subsp. abscessus]SKN09163.1 Uncharacterised protein [Mycobacteroides abscessus subsp. abscessus]